VNRSAGRTRRRAQSPEKLRQRPRLDWPVAMEAPGLPHLAPHALRHADASQLSATGLDVLTVHRRVGH
jgi:site-specific recombinase XerD